MFWLVWTIAGFFELLVYANLRDKYSRDSIIADFVIMLIAGPLGWAMAIAVLVTWFREMRKRNV